jgi:hypothetical protein
MPSGGLSERVIKSQEKEDKEYNQDRCQRWKRDEDRRGDTNISKSRFERIEGHSEEGADHANCNHRSGKSDFAEFHLRRPGQIAIGIKILGHSDIGCAFVEERTIFADLSW